MRLSILVAWLILLPLAARAAEPDYAAFDRLMETFMKEHDVPGGALAVSRGGTVVHSRGFGVADLENKAPVVADSLFRIASVSKPITAVAILKLVDQGKLKLDDLAWDRLDPALLPPLQALAGADPRLRQITLRHLLTHTAGFDREMSFDPMTDPARLAKEAGLKRPLSHADILRSMSLRKLDFDPGARHAYSNFGYFVLGRVIERASSQSYEKFVQDQVLKPMGVEGMRLGSADPARRAPGEVLYYRRTTATAGVGGKPLKPCFDQAGPVDSYDAHGGWLASARDLAAFAAAFDEADRQPLLTRAGVGAMFARPDSPAGFDAQHRPKPAYYALGWMVRPVGNSSPSFAQEDPVRRSSHWHGGRIPGTASLLVRRHDGWNWAVLFNTDANPQGRYLIDLIDPLLHQAADEAKRAR